jgi:hypothetical protein
MRDTMRDNARRHRPHAIRARRHIEAAVAQPGRDLGRRMTDEQEFHAGE